MSLTPRLTLIGLYENYSDSLFANLSFPDGIDAETFIDTLLLRYGECPLVYPNFDFMVLAIGAWSRKWYSNFARIFSAFNQEYNPLHNYDRTEEWTEKEIEDKNLNRDTETEENRTGNTESKVSAFNETTYSPSDYSEDSATNNSEGNEKINEDNTRDTVRSGRVYGNIGVTQSVDMLKNELDFRSTNNPYDIFAEMFYKEFCMYVF